MGVAAVALALLALVPPPPADGTHVVDTTGALSPSGLAEAEAAADDWQDRTGHDVVVAVVPTLEGMTVEAYTAKLFATWQPGREGVDDGVAIVVASLLSRPPADAVRARHRQVQASLREQGY